MLSFIRQFNDQLYLRAIDIEKSIKVRSSSVYTIMQAYLEKLCRILVHRESEYLDKINIDLKLVVKPSVFFSNEKVCEYFNEILEINDIDSLLEIINSGNTYKHDIVFRYDEKKIKDYFVKIYNLSVAIYRKYINFEKIDDFDDDKYKDFFSENNTALQNQINRLKEQYSLDKTQYEETIEKLKTEMVLLEEKKQELEKENSDLYDLYAIELDKEVESESLKDQILELSKEKISIDCTIEALHKEITKYKDELTSLERNIKIDSFDLEYDYTEFNKSHYYNFCGGYNESQSFVCYNIISFNKCFSKYKSFYAVINNLLQRGTYVKPSQFLSKYNLMNYELNDVYKYQILILLLIKNNILSDDVWNINLCNGEINLVKIAILDIFDRIKLLCELADQNYKMPIINLLNEPYVDFFTNISNSTSANFNVYSVCNYNFQFTNSKDYIEFLDTTQNLNKNLWYEQNISYKIKNKKSKLKVLFKEIFGYDDFRNGQFEIMIKIFHGENTIGILPTGAGKSVIFQFYALLEPSPTIIISPLISLIRDQIRNLNEKFNITRVNFIGDGRKLTSSTLNDLMIYISPERLQIESFRASLKYSINNFGVGTIVFDEVHCLSDWGHDFRIAYLMSKHILNRYFSNLQYVGLTATASLNVIKDLMSELSVKKRNIVAPNNLKRANLHYKVLEFPNLTTMKDFLLEKCLNSAYKYKCENKLTLPQVVFSKTKSECDNLCLELNFLNNEIHADYYYSNVSDKNKRFDNFIHDKTDVLFTTSAFGMGVDKPNIRCSYHFGIPSSMEAFFQESGRAGRDNESSLCYLLSYKTPLGYTSDVDKILDLNTKAKEFSSIQVNLKENTDLSTNLFFLSRNIVDPNEETEYVMTTYNRLIRDQKNNICTIPFKNKSLGERYLYKLFCIGIILDWSVNYLNSTFTVYLEDLNLSISYFKNKLSKYLEVREEIKLNKKLLDSINDANTIKDLILILCNWMNDNFVKYKREQLRNMYQFKIRHANKDSNDIQDELLSFFNLTTFLSEKEEDNITFEDKDVDYIFEKVIQMKEIEKERLLEFDHIMESNVSYKTELYVSLVNIKFGRKDEMNGKARFVNALKRMELETQLTFIDSIIENYNDLDNDYKNNLLKLLFEVDIKFGYYILKNINTFDDIAKMYSLSLINSIMGA